MCSHVEASSHVYFRLYSLRDDDCLDAEGESIGEMNIPLQELLEKNKESDGKSLYRNVNIDMTYPLS